MSQSSAPLGKRKASADKRTARQSVAKTKAAGDEAAEPGLVDQVRAMAGRFLDLSSAAGVAGRTLEAAGKVSRALRDGQPLEAAGEVLKAVLPGVPEAPAWAKTGALLRSIREAAGMTVAEVGAAINLDDPSLIDALENGRIALSFEVILRLAAVLGRNDPIGFVMRLTRTSNPALWQSLEALGIGKLILQTVREHQFVNVYRSNDDARGLSDEEFAEILSFTQAAFAMAMAMRARHRVRSSGQTREAT